MIDVNKLLSISLAPLNLPACEVPMTKNCDGTYITWDVSSESYIYASGKRNIRVVSVALYLWVIPDDSANDLAKDAIECLEANAIASDVLDALEATAYTNAVRKACMTDSQWIDAIGRRRVSIQYTMMERVV